MLKLVVKSVAKESDPLERSWATLIRWPVAGQVIARPSGFYRSELQCFQRWKVVLIKPTPPLTDLLFLVLGDENERDSSPRLDARRRILARVRFIYFFFL